MTRIFLIAGEASGDLLGQGIVRTLRQLYVNADRNLELRGVGGELMRNSGMELVLHYSKISVIGFIESILSIPRIWFASRKILKAIKEFKPDLILTIDFPGLNCRLVKSLRRMGITATYVHYVAPTVWAYKPERAQKIAQLFDHILLLFPFEKRYFQHMPHTVVGHPITERIPTRSITATSPNRSAIAPVTPDSPRLPVTVGDKHHSLRHRFPAGYVKILIMPGSRASEAKRHIRLLLATIPLLRREIEERLGITEVRFVMPVLPHLRSTMTAACAGIDNIELCNDTYDNAAVTSDLALVKIGTSLLEVITLGVPLISFYRASPLTSLILSRLLKLRFFALPNIIANKQIIPELVQHNCTPQSLSAAAIHLLTDQRARKTQQRECGKIIASLSNHNNVAPNLKAAQTIVELLR